MNGQTTFDLGDPTGGRSRAVDGWTSRLARQRSTRELEAAIVSFVAANGPATDDEIAAAFPHDYAPTVKSARSRCADLVDSGMTRLSNRGRRMIVWRLARVSSLKGAPTQ